MVFAKSTKTDGPLAIIEEENSKEVQVEIFPIPANRIVNINSPGDIFKITIFNSQGQSVFSQSEIQKEIKIDFSNFTEGLYIVNINKHGLNTSRRIVLK